MQRFRARLTFANVMSVIAVFIALGGVGYAAAKINGRTIKRSSIPGNRLKSNTVTGKQVKEAALGPVPTADRADLAANASTAMNLAAPEDFRLVGTAGQPLFQNGWINFGGAGEEVAFYKDREGVVHLRGETKGGTPNNTIFQLPPGYRPGGASPAQFAVACNCTSPDPQGGSVNLNNAAVLITGSGAVSVFNAHPNEVFLDGITFRAGS